MIQIQRPPISVKSLKKCGFNVNNGTITSPTLELREVGSGGGARYRKTIQPSHLLRLQMEPLLKNVSSKATQVILWLQAVKTLLVTISGRATLKWVWND